VSVYAQQVSLFAKAFEWGRGRLDFFAANAGIDDRESLYGVGVEEVFEVGGEKVKGPRELNLKTLRVDLDAVFQGIWLFRYWAGRNEGRKGGKELKQWTCAIVMIFKAVYY
jgi:15-hydroxyprostaglandin dehydrogenase (NAD)